MYVYMTEGIYGRERKIKIPSNNVK